MSSKTEDKNLTTLTLPLAAEKKVWIKEAIRDIPDFPKPGIIFKDLTPLLKDVPRFKFVIEALTEKCRQLKPDYIAGIEARGFLLGPTIAYELGIGFVPIRKPGKLPYKVQKLEYALEYGTDCVEVHADAVEAGQRVVVIDDLLATGGTADAARRLMAAVGGEVVGIGFIVELEFLSGRKKLGDGADIFSLISY
ncbi:MAG TPA: adenine phosphoribosyltransferase [Oculatellaceae cyanobacterium]